MTGYFRERALQAACLVMTAAALCGSAALAANPASGSVSGSSTQAAWTGGPLTPTAASTCGGSGNPQCDNYKLTIRTPSYSVPDEISLSFGAVDDYDLEVYGPDGALVGNSGNSAGQAEKVILV